MNLVQLPVGQSSTLTGFSEAGKKHQVRYLSLGLIPGAKVKVLRVAPLGCPLEIKVGSTLLSIRKTEAAELLVEDVA